MAKKQNANRNRQDDTSLKKGESQHSKNGYQYRWTDRDGNRHTVYASSLEALRIREKEIEQDLEDNIKREAKNVTINEMYELWRQVKRGLKDNTYQNYRFLYDQYVAPRFGKQKISKLVKSDIKMFYNMLVDDRNLSISTVESVHNVLHQVLEMAVDDCYIRRNPSDHVLKELKQLSRMKKEKRRALTKQEQDLFLNYLKSTPMYSHWYPIFAVMTGTGMRVGETVGLRWSDIDLEEGIININHTLVYYKHEINGCYCNVHSPKTENSIRIIPMLAFVKDAFLLEKKYQMENGIRCNATVDGYTDFIFVNRFGHPQHQGTLNKALKRIIRDCNDDQFLRNKTPTVLLPYFSCHILRHSFTTRMCEAGVNIKAIQSMLGHSDVSITLNIYTDATKDLMIKEITGLNEKWDRL